MVAATLISTKNHAYVTVLSVKFHSRMHERNANQTVLC